MNRLDSLILDIQQQEYKMLNTKSEILKREYLKKRKELIKELSYLLREVDTDITKTEQELLMAVIRDKITENIGSLGVKESEYITNSLSESYARTFLETQNIINSGIPTKGNIKYNILRPEMINSVVDMGIKGRTYSERVWINKENLAQMTYKEIQKSLQEDIDNAVFEGVIDGIDIRKLSKRIAERYNVGNYEARRLLQNETTRVITQAQKDIYQNSDAVEEMTFVATLDDRTTDICQSLDGNTYDKFDSSMPNIPDDTHVGCRSCYIPVVPNWSPTVRQDNINKEYIDYVTYEEWKEQN